jgi:hypothetical protein
MDVHPVDESHLLPCMVTRRKIVTEKTHYLASDPRARSVLIVQVPGSARVCAFYGAS